MNSKIKISPVIKKTKFFFEANQKKFFYVTLVIVFLLSFRTIFWGVTESWNPDQMAFKNLLTEPNNSLNPKWFLKPPFFTYIVYFLVVFPVKCVALILDLSIQESFILQLFFAQSLVLLLYLKSAQLVFSIVKKHSNEKVATLIGMLFISSAGFVAFLPFLTVDLPLLFFCVWSFYYCQKILVKDGYKTYLFAGFFVGLATAIKYNGVLIAPCLVIAHALREQFSLNEIVKKLFSSKLVAAFLAVIIGFILANPYSLITPYKFLLDFHYILVTDRLYETRSNPGVVIDHLLSIKEIIGWPTIILLVIIVASSFNKLKKVKKIKKISKEYLISVMSLGFIIPFCIFISSYNTSYTRYFIPLIPFLFFFTVPFWEVLTKGKRYYFTFSLVLLIVAYNFVSMYYVGNRFIFDSRMIALKWAQKNLRSGSKIENSTFMPTWKNYSNLKLVEHKMPNVNSTFNEVQFPSLLKKKKLAERSKEIEGDKRVKWYPQEWYSVDWYSREGLKLRNPDYISLNSWHFFIFSFDWFKQQYPEEVNYYHDLLNGELGYQVVFQANSLPANKYLYPSYIDFLDSKTIILEKK